MGDSEALKEDIDNIEMNNRVCHPNQEAKPITRKHILHDHQFESLEEAKHLGLTYLSFYTKYIMTKFLSLNHSPNLLRI